MKRVLFVALLTAILAVGICFAQTNNPSNVLTAAASVAQVPVPAPLAQQPPAQAPAPGAPAAAQAGRGGGGRGFGGSPTLGPDDKPAFPNPADGFYDKRDNVPHGVLTPVEYDSKSLGTRRRMRVYTPPGYSTNRKYPGALPAAWHRR